MNKGIFKTVHVLAEMVGRKLGLKVHIGGSRCCTNGNEIFLPSLPPDNDEAKVRAIGQIDHEALHVAETDFSVEVTPLVNIFEDARIEAIGIKRYPGMKVNLSSLVDLMVEDGSFKQPSANDEPFSIICGYILYSLRHKMLGQNLEKLAGEAEVLTEAIIGTDRMVKLREVLDEAPAMKSTQDASKLADKVLEILKEDEDDNTNGNSEGESDDNSDSDANSSSEGDAGDESDNDADSNSEGGTGDESSDDTNSDASGSSEGDAGDESGSDADSNSEGESDDNSDSDANSSSEGGAGGKAHYQFDESEMDNADWTNIAEANADKLSEFSESDEAIAASDVAGIANFDSDGYEVSKHEANMITNGLRQKLQARLQTMLRKRGTPKMTGVHGIENHKLGSLFAGNTRVFKSKVRKKDIDTYIHILIDASGSMNNGRDKVATQSAYAICKSLESIKGVDTEVSAFFGDFKQSVGVIKPMKQTTQKWKLKAYACGGTPLTQALVTTAMLTNRQSHKRKVLIVLTDGAPNCPQSSREVLQSMSKGAVEVYGIGIQSNAGEYIFDKWSSIDQLSELPNTMFDIIEHVVK